MSRFYRVYMMYDSQGRRIEKRVLNAAGHRTLRDRYVYNGYLCVQILNGDDGNAVYKEFIWDPTEPIATRPLFFRYVSKNMNLLYNFDGNKNVSEVVFVNPVNGIAAHYEYAPFGAITRTSKDTPITVVDFITFNPFRFSSEHHDNELGLVYYNYRHYNPTDGRWISRDLIAEQGGLNLYAFVKNKINTEVELIGYGTFEDVATIIISVAYEPVYSVKWETYNRCHVACGTAGIASTASLTAIFAGANVACFRHLNPMAVATCLVAARISFAEGLKGIKRNDEQCKEWCRSLFPCEKMTINEKNI